MSDQITDKITDIDNWLDAKVTDEYKYQPLAQDWARISKMAEEIGEAIQAFIGYTGQNPRKGKINDLADVLAELADTVLTGVFAIQHFTKDADQTLQIIIDKLNYQHDRMQKVMSGWQ